MISTVEDKNMPKLIVLLLLSLLFVGCHHGFMDQVRGSGNRQKQKREVPAFTAIHHEGNFDVDVVSQKGLSLEIEGDDNILPLISTEVSNNVLRIKSTRSYSVSEPVTLKISVPNLEAISVSGAGRFEVSGLKNDKFEIDVNGAPSVRVGGETKELDIDTNGAGKIDTHRLRATRARVESKGVSKVDIHAVEQLDVRVSGPSKVTYEGDPAVNKTVNGPGSVEKKVSEGS